MNLTWNNIYYFTLLTCLLDNWFFVVQVEPLEEPLEEHLVWMTIVCPNRRRIQFWSRSGKSISYRDGSGSTTRVFPVGLCLMGTAGSRLSFLHSGWGAAGQPQVQTDLGQDQPQSGGRCTGGKRTTVLPTRSPGSFLPSAGVKLLQFKPLEDQDRLSFESEPKPKEFRKTRIGANQIIFVSTTLDENGLCNCYKYVFELY